MEWLRMHAYLGALGVAAVLVVAGGFVVAEHSPSSGSPSTVTWGGGSPVAQYQTSSQPSPQQIAQAVVQNQDPATLNLPPLATSTPASAFEPTSGSFDYLALLEQLSSSVSPNAANVNVQTETSAATSGYTLIPETLVATSASPAMTAQQEALYNYGNEIGGEIQSFEGMNSNQAQVLKDQIEDRTDPTKAAAVVSLGQGLASVGQFMNHIQDVPPSAAALNSALAQSYIDIGNKLQLVPKAQGDANVVQAIENYDTAADTFVKNYGAMAQLFSSQGVTFSSSDPGSVFSFSNTGGSPGL